MALGWIVEIASLAMAGCQHGFGHDLQLFGREPTVWLVKGLFGLDGVGQQLRPKVRWSARDNAIVIPWETLSFHERLAAPV
jgi:hypothetical protein